MGCWRQNSLGDQPREECEIDWDSRRKLAVPAARIGAQCRMRALSVVIGAPFGNFSPRVEQIPEPAHVQALIAKPAVEALHVCVLCTASLAVKRILRPLHAIKPRSYGKPRSKW